MAKGKQQPSLVATPAELGAAVRAARIAMGLSIEQAAKLADVSPKMQMDIEIGTGDIYLVDALRAASLCGLELVAQPRGTSAMARILTPGGSPTSDSEAHAAASTPARTRTPSR